MSTPAVFESGKITIIGVGLIGGSLGLGLRRNARVGEIVGISRTERTLEKALELGVIDRASRNIAQEVVDSDIVVVAVPVQSIDTVFSQIASADYAGAIVTDVGSVKCSVIESGRSQFSTDYGKFVPAHPIAGTEHSGVEAAYAELFENRYTIITGDSSTEFEAIETVRSMWESVGSVIKFMEADEHDAVLAASSHLPHMLAFSLVHFIDSLPIGQRCFEFAAGGFYDFTRIASSDADMWRDICASNASHITRHLDGYIQSLMNLRTSIERNDTAAIHDIFSHAKRSRDAWIPKKTP